MKYLLLAAASVSALSSTSRAQVSGSGQVGYSGPQSRTASSKIILVPSVGTVSSGSWGGDQSGVGIDAKVALPSSLNLLGSIKVYSDTQAYSLGIEYGAAVGADGRLVVGGMLGILDVTNLVEFGVQLSVKAAYEHQIGSGLKLGLGFTHYFNESEVGDVTAPTFTVGYELSKAMSLEFTYSPEDAIFGVDGGENSMNLALNLSF
jgi:hypothetical protein